MRAMSDFSCKNGNKFCVIIPVHEFNDTVGEMVVNAIKSVPNDIRIIVSCKEGIEEDLMNKINNKTIEFCTSKNTTFQDLVNNGVDYGNTDWFSILEFDDIYTEIWFDEVEKYMKYHPEVCAFLPLTELFDYKEKRFIGYGNEAPWATSFSNEIGWIDNECIQEYFDFYLTGGVFNTQDFKNFGMLKPSMKVSFWYEFLLRMTNNSKKVFCIPKVGYVHSLNREGSLYDIYNKTIDRKESEWWFALAKKECFHKKDRKKEYVEESES